MSVSCSELPMSGNLLQPGQVLLFEGDSLSRRAMGASVNNWPLLRMNNWHRSWADLLEEWIFAHRPELEIRCHHVAIGGSTIADLEARYKTQVSPCLPSWIFLTLGTNDFIRGIGVDDFRSRLTTYIRTAQSEHGTRFFYLGGFLPMPGLPESETEVVEKLQGHFQAAREAVLASGGIAPDLGPLMKEKADRHFASSHFHSYYGDGLHFNALGNHVLAGLVMEELGLFAH